MDKLTSQVFMGNGDCGCTGSQIAHLYALLSEALERLSGVQQIDSMPPVKLNDSMSDKEWMEHVKELRNESDLGANRVREIADEIFLGLTGRKVVKTKE